GISTSLVAQDSARIKKTSKEIRRQEKRERINAMIKQEEEGVLSFRKQNVFGLQLRTNGYGAFYELGKMKSPSRTNLYSLEFTEIKNPKEVKSTSGVLLFGNPYIYGKRNNFYQVKLGIGQQYIFGQKGNKNGVAVTSVYEGGLSIGLLRPYYIEVDDNNQSRTIKFTSQDSVLFVNGFIIGAGGFGKGWSELKLRPGAYAKAALRFDYGRYNDIVSALEIGLSVDVYAQKVPIMVFSEAKQFFFQGHIAILFGRRR
ncbi:MAG: hypothetical protein M3O67_02865, partial [Bacteroidota bacterium]|nr:hypothetical protein [Bacteroidota bacterium]